MSIPKALWAPDAHVAICGHNSQQLPPRRPPVQLFLTKALRIGTVAAKCSICVFKVTDTSVSDQTSKEALE